MSPTAPPLLSTRDLLDGLAAAAERLASAASISWMGAEVPTCPDWTLLDLLAHTGMVHRWAAAAVENDRETMGDAELIEEEGRTAADPPAWLRAGAARFAEVLENADDGLEALVFLKEAPPPKQFWARRQCHETTIHALDAIAARDGRHPTAADCWFGAELAADGIDELLVGFWQRGKYSPHADIPYAALIRATDVDAAWLLQVGPETLVTTRVPPGESPAADATLSGTAVDLYLALWNRGGEIDDPQTVLDSLRERTSVVWS